MKNHLQAGNLDDFVKGIRLRDVRHNDDIQLILSLVRILLADIFCLLLGPNRRYDGMPLLEKLVEDVGCMSWSALPRPLVPKSNLRPCNQGRILLTGDEARTTCAPC